MKICFWAYKGGTGRSLLLANIGIDLASRGFNVGLVDLDMEAPGLHIIFGFNDEEIRKRGHLVDLLTMKSVINLNQYIVDINGSLKIKGNIYLLPTVNDVRLDDITWDHKLVMFMKDIFDSFIKFYQLNYLLIDTKTGFSPQSSLGKAFSDLMIVTMRPNRQNLLGVSNALRGFTIDQTKHYLVCSEVPDSKEAKKTIKKIEQVLQKKFTAIIPYDESLALEEKFLVMEKPESNVSRAYKNLTDQIVS
jgi:MinD-like ATPase involved in chromosome partitioning or flagellar assembly